MIKQIALLTGAAGTAHTRHRDGAESIHQHTRTARLVIHLDAAFHEVIAALDHSRAHANRGHAITLGVHVIYVSRSDYGSFWVLPVTGGIRLW